MRGSTGFRRADYAGDVDPPAADMGGRRRPPRPPLTIRGYDPEGAYSGTVMELRRVEHGDRATALVVHLPSPWSCTAVIELEPGQSMAIVQQLTADAAAAGRRR